jgi:SAM-dependent methyltransferase
MTEWALRKCDIITILRKIGFQYALYSDQVLIYCPEPRNNVQIKWIWSFHKILGEESQEGNTIKSNNIVFYINSSEKNISAECIQLNSRIQLFNGTIDKERFQFEESLLKYFQKTDLDSQSIKTVFGTQSFFYHLIEKFAELDGQEKKVWFDRFKEIYDERNLTDALYLNHKYLAFLLMDCVFKHENSSVFSKRGLENKLQLFPQFYDFILTENLVHFAYLGNQIQLLFDILFPSMNFISGDLFAEISQELITLQIRHPLGEVYTPKKVIQQMIQNKISTQTSFLDPSCGTGSFLVEIYSLMKKSRIITTKEIYLYGIDINPLSVMSTMANFMIILNNHELRQQVKVQIFNCNALYPDPNILTNIIKKNIDLIIGNPPWINLSAIISREYKEKLKILAKNLQILYPIESKNTEICTIFFNQCRDLYLKKEGEIFFLMPASVLNGRQHVFFRYFPSFQNIEVWRFATDIFKIHSICLYAKNTTKLIEDKESVRNRLVLKSILFIVDKKGNLYKTEEKSSLVPLYIKEVKEGSFPMVGRYNPISSIPESLQGVIPTGSPYYPMVKGGLRIVPRRWVTVQEKPPFTKTVVIHPDIKQQAKPQWSEPPYSQMKVESQYLHAYLKSEYLIPYAFVRVLYAFIPICSTIEAIKDRKVINTTDLSPNASNLYQLLYTEYRKRIKKSASMKTLADNFTYNNRLLPTNVLLKSSQVMVVHNSIGSIVKSAIIREPILLDNSIYYVILDDLQEAYYLCGILNSSVMTNLVRMIGSTGSRGSLRNIHKNPYNFPIPTFDRSANHIEIVNLSKKLENLTHKLIFRNLEFSSTIYIDLINSLKFNMGPRTIQRMVLTNDNFKQLRKKLDRAVRTIIKSGDFL